MMRAAHQQGRYAWIAPTYQTTERGLDVIRDMVDPTVYEIHGSGPRYADIRGCGVNSRLYFLSADTPDNIRGHGFRGIVIDEAPYVNVNAWTYVIRPTIAQTQGWAALVGTPKGRNWFFDMHTRGADPSEPDYESFTFPSNSNPYFPAEEWEEAQRQLPHDVFRQEFEAEFLEDSAGVFRGIEDCLCTGVCNHTGPYVIGCDLAKHQDYTVAIVRCTVCGCCVRIDRFNHIDWPEQKGRIRLLTDEYDATLMLDSTGVGDPIYDDLRGFGVNVMGVKFTQQTKTALIQGLAVAIEQRQVSWPGGDPEWQVLTDELKRYEYEFTAQGNLRYNAPSGYHDDCVIALALTQHGMSGHVTPSVFAATDERTYAETAIDRELAEIRAKLSPEELMELNRLEMEG
jgi:hypothetical protein